MQHTIKMMKGGGNCDFYTTHFPIKYWVSFFILLYIIYKICPFLIKSFRFWTKIELYANKRELTLMQQICIDSSQTF